MAPSNTSRILSQLLAVFVAVLVIATLYLAKTVIFPLALSLLVTFILAPLVSRMERIGVPRLVSVLAALLAAGVILGTIGWIVGTQLIGVADDFPAYTLNVQNKIDSFRRSKTTRFTRAQEEVNRISQQIDSLNADLTKSRAHAASQQLGASADKPLTVREVSGNAGRIDELSGFLGFLLTNALVVVFTFFMLLNREDLRNRFIRLTGDQHLNLTTQAMDDASRRVSRYLSLQLLVNAGFGTIIAISLQLLGLPHAMLWGFLAGILRFIPYIGAPIATSLPTALSIAVFDGWSKTILIVLIFFSLEIVTANFLEPHVYGRYTGLSSLAVLIAAIFWALIWGPVGLVLSVPLTVCLVVVGSHVTSLEFLTVLLGDQPVMAPGAHYYQRLLANDEREASRVVENFLRGSSIRDLYDLVLIPALSLAEQDRHRNELDEATVTFIMQTTKDLVEEVSFSAGDSEQASEASGTGGSKIAVIPIQSVGHSKRITCVPVRDDADEIIGIMLRQLLRRAGYSAKTVPLGTVDRMVAETIAGDPDIVCLSALPPYAISHARNLYSKLRQKKPGLKIIIGLWSYTDDPLRAAEEISGGELSQLYTTLTQITLQAGTALQLPANQQSM